MRNESTRKLLPFVLVLALSFSFSTTVASADRQAEAYGSECVLEEVVRQLSDDKKFGIRYYGTPNELKAVEYVKEQFDKYDSLITEVVEVPLKFPGGYLYPNSIGRPGVIELIDGPWIMGRPMPNNDTLGTSSMGDYSGVFHDFGTFPNISLPDGLTSGGIYGTLRFNANATLANINTVIAAIDVKYEEAVKLTGLFVSRSDSVAGTPPPHSQIHANIANVPVSTVGLTLNCLENVAEAGRNGNIDKVFRFTPSVTYAAYATKPAATDNPDLVIIVTGHIDGVWGAPSANDNASAVAVAVEMARRFSDVDTGNIELIFAAIGGEEYGDFEGASYLCERLVEQGKDVVAINMNMDMVATPEGSVSAAGRPINTMSVGIWMGRAGALGNSNPPAHNLASHLVTSFADEIEWAEGIDNVQIFSWGASDHMMFTHFGMDAFRLVYTTDPPLTNASNAGLYDYRYHTSLDNFELNYSYDRHLKAANLMANAIQKAIDLEVTKRAKFYINEELEAVTLSNSDQLFKAYSAVTGVFSSPEGDIPFEFTPENTVIGLAGAQDYEVANVLAHGIGIANYKDAAMNEQYKHFRTKLVAQAQPATLDEAIPSAEVERLNGNRNNLTITVTEVYSDGLTRDITETISINNNAAGTYKVGEYMVYVDTKGNDQIRSIHIVK